MELKRSDDDMDERERKKERVQKMDIAERAQRGHKYG